MRTDQLYAVLVAQIASGMISSGRTDDNQIIEDAKLWAKMILIESNEFSIEFAKNTVSRLVDNYTKTT
jgi:hypothetical protein